MRQALKLIICLFTLTAETSAAEPPALVGAKVLSVETEANGKVGTATIEIVHVYSGNAELKGKTFQDTYRLIKDVRGQSATSAFKVNEEALWSLNKGFKGQLVPVWDQHLPFYLRSRNDVRPNCYDAHVKLAEAIESVAATKESDQVKKLISLAEGESPVVARWAVSTLGESKEAEAGKFLDAFADKPNTKMPLCVQIAMDEALSKVRREDWFRADTRMPLLSGWVTSKADEGDASLVLIRIDRADDGRQIRFDVACELVSLAVGNKDWPLPARKQAVTLLGKLGEKVVDDSAAFDRLLDVVRNGKEKPLREAAADSILKHLQLDDKRRTALDEAQANGK